MKAFLVRGTVKLLVEVLALVITLALALRKPLSIAISLMAVDLVFALPGGAALMALMSVLGYHVGFGTCYPVIVLLGVIWFSVDAARRVAAAQ